MAYLNVWFQVQRYSFDLAAMHSYDGPVKICNSQLWCFSNEKVFGLLLLSINII